MKSYFVLTPPGLPDLHHERTIVLADGISWLALFFPWIWLLTKRLWLAATVVFLLQLVAGQLAQMPGLEVAGLFLGLSTNVLVALEGRHFYSEALIRRGWTLDAVFAANDLDSAEEVYLSAGQPSQPPKLPTASDWTRQNETRPHPEWSQGGIGLFDHQGGR